jgi:uncharacterized protein YecT (DUF1311 family)
MRVWIAVAVMGLMAGSAQAQEVDCDTAEAQADLTLCAGQEWQAADVELNASYKQAMQVLQDMDAASGDGIKGADLLKQAQRDWITFRDTACAAEAWPMHGGSAEPMLVASCKARLTEERTLSLDYIGQGE